MEISGGVNKYLHKKFKKQTSIEPSIVVANHVPIRAIQEQQQEHVLPFWHHNSVSTNHDDTHKSSISSELSSSLVDCISNISESSDNAYTFANGHEPAGATALVVRKLDSEQSDEDISNNIIVRNIHNPNKDKEPTHSFPSSSTQQIQETISKIKSRFNEEWINRNEEQLTTRGAYEASTSNSSALANPSASNGNGKYVCPFCNLACSKPSVLQKHIRAHTNERPYPCQSCNFSFKTRSNLYKHCRSRTHVNRVMGNKTQDNESVPLNTTPSMERTSVIAESTTPTPVEIDVTDVPSIKPKPYKPRFHTKSYYDENEENSMAICNENNHETHPHGHEHQANELYERLPPVEPHHHPVCADEPLNLTSKNRKRCLSEAASEPAKKSLIKELLLKNLYADTNMQCPHCKMIFRTFTELELHKMKMCKGRGGARYSRSSSVNVASLLTNNKNAFDSIPQIASMFPLKSPGPFLGKTRLVEADKNKSFSCDDNIQGIRDLGKESPYYQSSFDFLYDKMRKPPVKLFGGEVKVTPDNDEETYPNGHVDKHNYQLSPKLSENRVIRNTLQSGGIVLHAPQEKQPSKGDKERHLNGNLSCTSTDYGNIMDFSQNAAKLLAPSLKQLNLTIPGIPTPTKFIESAQPSLLAVSPHPHPKPNNIIKSPPKVLSNGDLTNPMSLLVNGKVVRYVPGMPGPVIAETIKPKPIIQITPSPPEIQEQEVKIEASTLSTTTMFTMTVTSTTVNVKVETMLDTLEPPPPPRKFARPNSLALKPTSTSMKHHHGLTPTMFNQILISPDTPRGDKKYNEQFLHGNYFSYLGLKSSTRPVYCTLNKTQPFYVPHFKKLSMYSEWRQQDNKSDKLYVSNYDSRQRSGRFSISGKYEADNVVHSSYKFVPGEVKDDTSNKAILGGYESHEDYTYVRGRGRGRFVCDQCGIRCKKPSMLRKHIRTHSNDRPYTCKLCKFSFKTKGNLTKHMKSKAHTKNYAAGMNMIESDAANSSDTETDDSGMDSSDESSTRNQEHEAAYGLLSLSQKISPSSSTSSELQSPKTLLETTNCSFMNAEQLVHVSKTNYAKNKFLDQNICLRNIKLNSSSVNNAMENNETCVTRPLTYPYTTLRPIPSPNLSPNQNPNLNNSNTAIDEPLMAETTPVIVSGKESPPERDRERNHINVIKRYNPNLNKPVQSLVQNKTKEIAYQPKQQQQPQVSPIVHHQKQPVQVQVDERKRKLSKSMPETPEPVYKVIVGNNESEAMDLSVSVPEKEKNTHSLHNNNRVAGSEDKYEHYIIQTNTNNVQNGLMKIREYDNSAMETLADIATKQEKLEKNSVAKNVATEFLKLATKNDNNPKTEEKSVKNELIKSEENKNCAICNKTFNKPSQLRLHMNIHYLERPYRCESCSVSFRTKGHLQKHERSAGHHNKLSTSPALSSQEPRPFKCTDCRIAFRIHGHLAKHLRSKMHILKLECLSKIPFGLYAELERSNSLLTEINTADGDQCLDSLQALAKRIFINDPSKLNQTDDKRVYMIDPS